MVRVRRLQALRAAEEAVSFDPREQRCACDPRLHTVCLRHAATRRPEENRAVVQGPADQALQRGVGEKVPPVIPVIPQAEVCACGHLLLASHRFGGCKAVLEEPRISENALGARVAPGRLCTCRRSS